MIGPDVMIFTQNHRHDRLDIPMRLQTDPKRPVVIEDDVWIGARVIILPGVTIHKEPLLVREPLSQHLLHLLIACLTMSSSEFLCLVPDP